MPASFAEAKQKLGLNLHRLDPSSFAPLAADPWVLTSLLQKAIRRGETEIAMRAANTLFALKGAAIWRRYMIIAFEDIGIGSIDAVVATVAAATDADFRKQGGGPARVAIGLAELLALAAKDRSSDHLHGARDHPSMATTWQAMSIASDEDRLSVVFNNDLPLASRAMATRSLSGLSPGLGLPTLRSQLTSLLTAFSDAGVPEELVAATEIAALRTREPITVMIPLLWLAANNGQVLSIQDCPVTSSPIVRDIPLYALDMHTRLGGEAIRRLTKENEAVREFLEQYVPPNRWREAAYVAAFHVDASPVKQRLVWDQSWAVEKFGVERDLAHSGVKLEGVVPLVRAIRDNIDDLNKLRSDVLLRSSPPATGIIPPHATGDETRKTKHPAQPSAAAPTPSSEWSDAIGLRSDGTLNVLEPGSPPARWFKARKRSGEIFYIGLQYGADGRIVYSPDLSEYDVEEEVEETLRLSPRGWKRDGLLWRKV